MRARASNGCARLPREKEEQQFGGRRRGSGGGVGGINRCRSAVSKTNHTFRRYESFDEVIEYLIKEHVHSWYLKLPYSRRNTAPPIKNPNEVSNERLIRAESGVGCRRFRFALVPLL